MELIGDREGTVSTYTCSNCDGMFPGWAEWYAHSCGPDRAAITTVDVPERDSVALYGGRLAVPNEELCTPLIDALEANAMGGSDWDRGYNSAMLANCRTIEALQTERDELRRAVARLECENEHLLELLEMERDG